MAPVEGGLLPGSIDLSSLVVALNGASSGLGYVYWCLDELAGHLHLEDVVLVSELPALGHQVFHRRSRPLADMAGQPWLSSPGLHLRPDPMDAGDKSAVIALCELALSMELARHDAAHDALTGLLNRRSFEESLSRFMANAGRHAAHFSVALLDVDGLKSVNDTWGHWEGDRLLQTTGVELRRSIRGGDVAARLGGDEFALLLVSDLRDTVGHFRDRLQSAVAAAVGRGVRYSIGVAHSTEEPQDPGHLFRLADSRLYDDKRSSQAGPDA